jgi:hypothetical protein
LEIKHLQNKSLTSKSISKATQYRPLRPRCPLRPQKTPQKALAGFQIKKLGILKLEIPHVL